MHGSWTHTATFRYTVTPVVNDPLDVYWNGKKDYYASVLSSILAGTLPCVESCTTTPTNAVYVVLRNLKRSYN